MQYTDTVRPSSLVCLTSLPYHRLGLCETRKLTSSDWNMLQETDLVPWSRVEISFKGPIAWG